MILKKILIEGNSRITLTGEYDKAQQTVKIEEAESLILHDDGIFKYNASDVFENMMNIPGVSKALSNPDFWAEEIQREIESQKYDEDYENDMEEQMEAFKSKLSVAESLVIPMPVAKISKQYYQS